MMLYGSRAWALVQNLVFVASTPRGRTSMMETTTGTNAAIPVSLKVRQTRYKRGRQARDA